MSPSRDSSSNSMMITIWLLNLFLTLGAFVQISGGYWDITRHIMNRPETFFTVQHLMIYAGVGIVTMTAFLGLLVRRSHSMDEAATTSLLRGIKLATIGAALQLVAGPFDFWWHSTFGFDPVLLSPPHVMLIVGAAVNGFAATIGMMGLRKAVALNSIKAGLTLRRIAAIFTILALAALWLDLNLVIYTGSDLSGLRYQYHVFNGGRTLDIPPAYSLGVDVVSLFILALPGVLILISAARSFGRFGGATAVAATFIAVNLITSIIERGFLSYVPTELSMIVPAVALDYLASRGTGGYRNYLIAAMIFAPFSYALYFPFTVFYLGSDVLTISLYMLLPYLGAGLFAQRLSFRFRFDPSMPSPPSPGAE